MFNSGREGGEEGGKLLKTATAIVIATGAVFRLSKDYKERSKEKIIKDN